eukprot:GHRR01023254.1.p1 GENE.GHRR01023254.1~~GHRR01023254.1.p1  ORF type:complete len:114 (+),score=26.97 GHRR01023254.1:99-440(+)
MLLTSQVFMATGVFATALLSTHAQHRQRDQQRWLVLTSAPVRPEQVPLSYPFVEAFRLSMLAMSHKDFPFNVLGAVLARNSSIFMRPLHADEALTFRSVRGHCLLQLAVLCPL